MKARNLTLSSRGIFSLILFVIVLAAAWIRTYDLNWDEGTHLHPDERYLTMVVSAIDFPETLRQYWATDESPLNPTNFPQFATYVYGTLPLFTTRAMAGWVDHEACGSTPTALGAEVRGFLLDGHTSSCREGFFTGYNGIHLVGRSLSTLADLTTLLGLAVLARALYGKKVALLAATLYAFSVLPIQHAHFFVVDSFATVFVVWTLCFAVWAVQQQRVWWLLPAGLATGLAVASKISVFPVAGVVALAALLKRDVRTDGSSRYRFVLLPSPVIAALISGVLAALAFRLAQPYAFTGPGFFDIRINPQWMETMRNARDLANGLQDVPFGHQWTDRTPIIFPWRNMVFWGMGLPLGLVAWIGWAAMGWRIFRRARWQHLLAWAWGTVFFLYQGTQWVKSMRYLLPVYPVFALFAAWLLARGVAWGQRLTQPLRLWQKVLKPIALALPVVVLAGTIVWALAFLQVYAGSLTRVEASRWMYDNIPTVATLHAEPGASIQIPVSPDMVLSENSPLIATVLVPEVDNTITRITVNKADAMDVAGTRTFRATLMADPYGDTILGEGVVQADLPASAPALVEMPLSTPVHLEAGKPTYFAVTILAGAPVKLRTSVIANEHWDDALPQRIDGKDAFGSWYRSLHSSPGGQMNNYDNDTPEKREALFDWLDEADYIALSSNRLYASIPRLPTRYPFTTAYYEALFNGSLGFELVAEFVHFPSIGPCQFPDQEIPFPLMEPRFTNARPCSIKYPPAEEAFSVYDHPTVLIFAKTPRYSRERAEILLPISLLADVEWLTPLEATRGKQDAAGRLLMTPQMRAAQEFGGTWSRLFNRNALQNRSQVLAVIVWWLMLSALGAIAFPWLYAAFPALRYRGYGLARAVGLLLWAYLAWLLASLHLLPHTRLLLWGVFALLVMASAIIVRARWEHFRAFFRENWRNLLWIEVIFAVLYVAWVYVRYLNPDLWHPVAGGEKPMDFAYLNAVIKSTWFPPYDPWFAGGTMNYYYFGFVMVGSLIKALGILPSVGYNLAVPALYAMTGVGAYTLANNLAGKDSKRGHIAGLIGIFVVLILGNLGELRLVFTGLEKIGNIKFESLIPGYPALVSAIVGLWKVVVTGQTLTFRPEWWYWNATRVIPFGPGEVGAINEFPAFTFLYADLHAHMMAFPLTQVALAIALQWGLGNDPPQVAPMKRTVWVYIRRCIPRPLATFFLAGLVAGALHATNTWDWPTYLALMSVGLLFSLFNTPNELTIVPAEEDESDAAIAGIVTVPEKPVFAYYKVLTPVLFVLLGEILFRPFIVNYVTAYTSFALWRGTRTTLGIYLIMHGQFLLPLAILGVVQGRSALQRFWKTRDPGLLLPLGLVLLGMAVLWLVLIFIGVPVAWVVIPLGALATILVLDPRSMPRERLLWMWTGTALTLSLVVEILVLKGDIGRMNTVFKFYLQVWMLLALSAAVALERILHYTIASYRTGNTPVFKVPDWINDVVAGLVFFVVAATAMYPLMAIPAKVRDRWAPSAPRTLDGMAYIPYATQHEHGSTIPLAVDDRVIRWMQENVEGSPTIIEEQAEREYLWGNRVSVYTGLPSVAAWRWHSVQQRLVMPGGTVEARQRDIRYFYSTTDPYQAMDILRRYHVQYVILTPYDRAYMLPEGLPKFTAMVERGMLEPVYQDEDAVIYKVTPP